METVAVDEEGFPLEQGDYQMAGVADPGVEIKVAFVEPAGSMTGKLFPSGNTEDTIIVETPTALLAPFSVQATLIDAANPFVVVDAEGLPLTSLQGSSEWLQTIEDIRRKGAVMMGLADSIDQAALTRGTPKIMIVSSPPATDPLAATGPTPDIAVLSMSMGQLHPSVQLTGAVCLAAATCLKGTVAYRCRRRSNLRRSSLISEFKKLVPQDQHATQPGETIVIAHRSGQIPVGVHVQGPGRIEKCVVSRTARKLFEGHVLFYL